MHGVIFLIGFATLATAAYIADPNLDDAWNEWKNTHSKSYESEEEVVKRAVWEDNLSRVNMHNLEHSLGIQPFTMRMNHLADQKINRNISGYEEIRSKTRTKRGVIDDLLGTVNWKEKGTKRGLPGTVDWREKGYVMEVGNEGQCQSSVAFSATGSLERQLFKKTGILEKLRVQELVDCSITYGNNGCWDGFVENAFEYIKDNGITTEECYPYVAHEQRCRVDENCARASVKGWVEIPSGDEMALQQAVATVGPVSAIIDIYNRSFILYSWGIYNEPLCSSAYVSMSHNVLIVGYGTQDGKDYWLVKNSWGRDWGDGGYIKMSRNKGNQCGIATRAVYPIV